MSKSNEAGRIDLRTDIDHANETLRNRQLCFRLKQTMPLGDEYNNLVKELFYGNIGEGSYMMPPLTVVGASRISIGKNVFIMDGILLMGSGGITIEDNVQLAANVQILSNNHDLRDREVITLAPVKLCKGAWIGAGATNPARCDDWGERCCGSRFGGHPRCRSQYHRGRQSGQGAADLRPLH